MGSFQDSSIAHWGHEPWERRHLAGEFLDPTTQRAGKMPALPGRFMGSCHDFPIAHPGHETEKPLRWRVSVLDCASPLALSRAWEFQSGRGLPQSKTWRTFVRFLESCLFHLDLLTAHEPNNLPKIWDDQRFQLPNLWPSQIFGRFLGRVVNEPHSNLEARADLPPDDLSG